MHTYVKADMSDYISDVERSGSRWRVEEGIAGLSELREFALNRADLHVALIAELDNEIHRRAAHALAGREW